jgi:type 1 fimbria pilin
MFIVYFDYLFSIVSSSLCLCISSYSAHPDDHRMGGRDHVSMVLRCYLPTNTVYIPGHVVDHGCDITIESFGVHSPNIGHRSRVQLQRKGKLCS